MLAKKVKVRTTFHVTWTCECGRKNFKKLTILPPKVHCVRCNKAEKT